jgi:hypothetical protein
MVSQGNNGGVMKNFGKYVLGAALVAGGLGLGATSAQAAEFRIAIGGPAAYIPPSPGVGYVWVAGYYNNGYWVPGYWNYAGVGYVRDRRPVVIYDRDHDRRYAYADRDDHRRFDRDDHRGGDRDGNHFRR